MGWGGGEGRGGGREGVLLKREGVGFRAAGMGEGSGEETEGSPEVAEGRGRTWALEGRGVWRAWGGEDGARVPTPRTGQKWAFQPGCRGRRAGGGEL